MAGRQAKILSDKHVEAALCAVLETRYPARNRAILLLSVKAGLRAGEIAKLTWPMVCGPDSKLGETIELHDIAAKKCSGRTIPMHGEIKRALTALRRADRSNGPVVRSERGEAMSAASIVNWFAAFYRTLDLKGCSSHSGRRTFITKAARLVHRTGGSLRDIQQLAGHRSIEMTQRYIDGDTRAKRALVDLL
jgi:integrase/recombinase XerD